MAEQKQGDQVEPTYSSSVWIRDVALSNLPEAMNDREEWRERVRDIRAGGTTTWWWYVCMYVKTWFGIKQLTMVDMPHKVNF